MKRWLTPEGLIDQFVKFGNQVGRITLKVGAKPFNICTRFYKLHHI